MRKITSSPFVLVVSFVCVVVVGFILLSGDQDATRNTDVSEALRADPSQSIVANQNIQETIPIPDLVSIQEAREEPLEAQDYVQEMIARIKSELGDSIHLIAVQAGLKEFKDDLVRGYPEQGLQMFEQIIRAAFPELADRILEVVALMDSYEAWLLASMLELNEMDLAEQQETLWEKRYAMFQEDARLIWPQELSAEEEREESVRRTVAMLDQAHDMSMDERLYLLQNTFAENYDATVTNLVLDTTGVMTQVFFRFESVQKELGQLSNEERQEQINEIRRKVGVSEKMVQELAERDQEKEARWQNGYAYMEQRNALTEKGLSDESLQQELVSLRENYFGNEAYTIGKEEDELGFFRYERPRVYGWN